MRMEESEILAESNSCSKTTFLNRDSRGSKSATAQKEKKKQKKKKMIMEWIHVGGWTSSIIRQVSSSDVLKLQPENNKSWLFPFTEFVKPDE